MAYLTRWDAELKAKHAEVMAAAVPALVLAQFNPAVAEETGRPVHAAVAGPLGR